MMTPGVYIVEKDAFPSSVVEVATAVPAFIGFTERVEYKGQSLLNAPKRITSLAEYHQYYGFGPDLTGQFTITQGAPGAGDTAARKVESRRYMYYGLKSFYQNGGGPCYIVSIGDYATGLSADAFTFGIDQLLKEQEPTMVVYPDAVLMSVADCQAVQSYAIAHCAKTQSRFTILDVPRGYLPRSEAPDCIEEFRGLAASEPKYCAAYYPWLDTTVVSATEMTYQIFENKDVLQKILTDELNPSALPAAKKAQVEKLIADIADDNAPVTITNDGVRALSQRYKDLVRLVQEDVNRIPPSATMAGVYSQVDAARGVWKAPANVALGGVVKPTVNITHDEQEDLNVTVTGKSVNAIRTFVGEGTVVWGARTLDGNSLDWRYVNVRRTMIMLEQSIKAASKSYVFEANDANTWITIKSMIRNFLTGIWKRGGLAGASPDDAFSVFVGLGETMTPEDILEGILRVTVLVALIRPAE
jgi:phage tail sheath protein FI